ncbi:MAG: hypothetical protein ACRDFB_03305 [Rhabdochlamydiaceae bacterium]
MIDTQIANLALRHLGSGKQIADLQTDESEEAKILRDLFSAWMETVLRGYSWKFATVYSNIQPFVTYPNQEWRYGYRYPADCLYLLRFWNGKHLDDKTNTIPFSFSEDNQGRIILSDYGPSSAITSETTPETPNTVFTIAPGDILPVIEYTRAFSAIRFIPPDFIFAFSVMLAGWAAPSLPAVGMVDLRDKNLALGTTLMQAAMARDANEQRPPFHRLGELSKCRFGMHLSYTQAGFQFEPASYIP